MNLTFYNLNDFCVRVCVFGVKFKSLYNGGVLTVFRVFSGLFRVFFPGFALFCRNRIEQMSEIKLCGYWYTNCQLNAVCWRSSCFAVIISRNFCYYSISETVCCSLEIVYFWLTCVLFLKLNLKIPLGFNKSKNLSKISSNRPFFSVLSFKLHY